MDSDGRSTSKKSSTKASTLNALDCLATAAGQLHSHPEKPSPPNSYGTLSNYESLSQKMSAPNFGPVFSPFSQNLPNYHNNNFAMMSVPFSTAKFAKSNFYGDEKTNFPLKSSTMKDFVQSCLSSAPCSQPSTSNQSFFMTPNPPSLCRMNSPASVPGTDLFPKLPDEVSKSAFKVVSSRPYDEKIEKVGFREVITSVAKPVIPEQPPTLFRMDPLLDSKNGSLFETLVEESQKILSSQEKEKRNQEMGILAQHSQLNENETAASKQESSKKMNEIMLVSPHRKQIRKRKTKTLAGVEGKRAYGGPPFNPGACPPKPNTASSALCTLHEHTLLKMATRGFWSGDRGPLQDVFRLTRVENSDLQYNVHEITKHCYKIVKNKLENISSGIEEKEIMQKHMRCYVDELDSYLERIYPVSSVAINIYLPTATDYAAATWHGIVPTGWSEYRRAVVIREVFEVLYHLSTKLATVPDFHPRFFSKKVPDSSLYPLTNQDGNNNNNNNIGNGINPSNDDTKDNLNEKELDFNIDLFEIKYSRAFEALWTRTTPHEPFLIIDDIAQLKLREYLEKFPVETNAPSDNAIIVIDDKKYKAREILGYFRRGVQLVDYSKETGGMLIDTISTIRNISITSAVRKIPPGKISKLVHPDLHLENYTNAILQVGSVASDGSHGMQPVIKFRGRKRRIKIQSSLATNKKQSKVKAENEENPVKQEDLPTVTKLESIASFCEPLQAKLDSFERDIPSSRDREEYMPPKNFTENKHVELNKNVFGKMQQGAVFNLPNPDFLPPKPEISNLYTPDILSSMHVPPGTTGELFSLHLMIDSYRRAAKYLLDTANHLELVARRGADISRVKKDQSNDNES